MNLYKKSILIILAAIYAFDLQAQVGLDNNSLLLTEGFGKIELKQLPSTPNLLIENSYSFLTVNPLDPKGGILYNSLFHKFQFAGTELLHIDDDKADLNNIELNRNTTGDSDLLPHAYAVFRRNAGMNTTLTTTGNISITNISGGIEVTLNSSEIAQNMVILVTLGSTDIVAVSQSTIDYIDPGMANDHKFTVLLYSSSGSSVSDNYIVNVVIYKP